MSIYRCPECDGVFDDDYELGTDVGSEDLVCPRCYEEKYYETECICSDLH